MQRIEAIAAETPGVQAHGRHRRASRCCSGANAPNFGSLYVMLDDFHDRPRPGPVRRRHRRAAAGDACSGEIQDGLVNVFGAPPVDGLGTAGGFKLMIEDRGDTGPTALQAAGRRRRRRRRRATPELRGLFTSFRADTPWLYLDIDRTQAQTMGVSIADVFNTLQVYFGSLYVNDFNRFGRTWQVNVQADARVPRPGRGPAAAQGPQRRAARWCRSARSPSVRDVERPGDGDALQPVPGGGGQRRRRARAPAPARRSTRLEAVGEARPAAVDARRVDRAGPAAAADGQHGDAASSCWRWCWCSWCWRRSTRAGRCRWRSSSSCRCACCARSAGVLLARHGHQHLHADRLRGAGRAGVQERDPDRRVRQAAARGRGDRAARRRWRRAGCGCGRS